MKWEEVVFYSVSIVSVVVLLYAPVRKCSETLFEIKRVKLNKELEEFKKKQAFEILQKRKENPGVEHLQLQIDKMVKEIIELKEKLKQKSTEEVSQELNISNAKLEVYKEMLSHFKK